MVRKCQREVMVECTWRGDACSAFAQPCNVDWGGDRLRVASSLLLLHPIIAFIVVIRSFSASERMGGLYIHLQQTFGSIA